MSVEAYLATLPEDDRASALSALQRQCRDPQGNQSAVWASVEAYIDAGWRVGRPNGRGIALVHRDAGEPLTDRGLGAVGMAYAEFLTDLTCDKTIASCRQRFCARKQCYGKRFTVEDCAANKCGFNKIKRTRRKKAR